MDNYYDKLKALLEALEVQNIEHLLLNGDVETYQIIGKTKFHMDEREIVAEHLASINKA